MTVVVVPPATVTGLVDVIVPLTAVEVTVKPGLAMLNVGKVSNVPEFASVTLICPVNDGFAVVGVPEMVRVALLTPLATAVKPGGMIVIQVKDGATPLAVHVYGPYDTPTMPLAGGAQLCDGAAVIV